MPDLSAYLPIAAFVLGGLFNAVVSAASSEYRSRQDHRRAGELDKTNRSRLAAAALLEEFDRLAEMFSSGRRASHIQSDIEPNRRVIRRRAVEFEDVRVRRIIEEIADIFYYHHDDARFGSTSTLVLTTELLESARQVLGAVIRGESYADPVEMSIPRHVAKEATDFYSEQYEEERAYERGLAKRGADREEESPHTHEAARPQPNPTINAMSPSESQAAASLGEETPSGTVA